MSFYSSFYMVLGVMEDATIDVIKSAFRKLALIHHPDKNGNSPGSQGKFLLISNAYEILTDSVKRKEYDTYLRNSSVLRSRSKTPPGRKKALPGRAGDVYRSNEALLGHFNFLLWDIEDLIRDTDKRGWRGQHILRILAFIDKWVLIPAGYPDYFMEARQMNRTDPMDYIKNIGINRPPGHQPYISVTDYFYNIRKRMDSFLNHVTMNNLAENIPNHDLRLIDCIVEAQNYSVHYLSYLLQGQAAVPGNIPRFKHSKDHFDA